MHTYNYLHSIYCRLCFLYIFCQVTTLQAAIPFEMEYLPYADKQGIVLKTQTISIEDAQYPYNASLVFNQEKQEYLLFFREDTKDRALRHIQKQRIGIATLDTNFKQKKPSVFPSLTYFGIRAHDPRAFYISNELYMIFYGYTVNKITVPCLIKLNKETLQLEYGQILTSPHAKLSEKNWTPLLSEENSPAEVKFITMLYPYQEATYLLKEKQLIRPQVDLTSSLYSTVIDWKWGTICGGTQAVQLENGYYLNFFHSWFLTRERKRFYVMGACLLDKKTPHKIVAISKYPLFWKGIYQSAVEGKYGPAFSKKWARNLERVVFPVGLLLKKTKSRLLAYVTYGENDNSIKVATIDVKKLLKTLVLVDETRVDIRADIEK